MVLRLRPIWFRAHQAGRAAPLRIGYARVSGSGQRTRLQLHALSSADCDVIYCDKAKGTDLDRAGLEEALLCCRQGDEFIMWKLDRLSRRQLHVVQILEFLVACGVSFRIIEGIGSSIDANEPEGRTLIGMLAAFGEYEWELVRARTRAGIAGSRSDLWRRIERRQVDRIHREAAHRRGSHQARSRNEA